MIWYEFTVIYWFFLDIFLITFWSAVFAKAFHRVCHGCHRSDACCPYDRRQPSSGSWHRRRQHLPAHLDDNGTPMGKCMIDDVEKQRNHRCLYRDIISSSSKHWFQMKLTKQKKNWRLPNWKVLGGRLSDQPWSLQTMSRVAWEGMQTEGIEAEKKNENWERYNERDLSTATPFGETPWRSDKLSSQNITRKQTNIFSFLFFTCNYLIIGLIAFHTTAQPHAQKDRFKELLWFYICTRSNLFSCFSNRFEH